MDGETTPFAGTGNICADPALAGVGTGDAHETASSPTIDAGSNALVPSGVTSDFFGQPRILVGKFGDADHVADLDRAPGRAHLGFGDRPRPASGGRT